MPGLRAEAGSRPGGRGTFLCFAKEKYPKERRPPVCDPFAVRRGKPAAGRLRGASWNSLCAARAARTSTASQFTKHGRFDAHATPQPPRRRRSQQGWGAEHPNSHTGHRCARPRLRSVWRLRPRDGAERSAAKQWPEWMSLGFPSGCAWGAQGAGWHVCRRTHMLRELTHRSWSSEAPQARSEFCGAPRDRAPQVAP
ncbi:hypothetical protein ATF69_0254 [Acidovorax delafieldii]|uniref:Uncharacterized protein n=1 Tax=Acidovorax delafieldii TaxID=47920 RepID=A0A561XXY7_ACIDE|nr:hypothetical protein ATF69_0254 [Acidovorax delafieldii]